jgi:hypothetical protein
MQLLEDAPQAIVSSGVSANALLKFARKHGNGCRMNVRATVRDLADALQAGCVVLIHGNGTRDVFIVVTIEEGIVTLNDARTGEDKSLSVPQFGALWHGNREDRTGRMMVVMPRGA